MRKRGGEKNKQGLMEKEEENRIQTTKSGMKILNIFRNSKSESAQPWAGLTFKISFFTVAISLCHCCYQHIRVTFYQDLSHVPDMNSTVYQQQTRLLERRKKGKKLMHVCLFAPLLFCWFFFGFFYKKHPMLQLFREKQTQPKWDLTCSLLCARLQNSDLTGVQQNLCQTIS